MLLEVLFGSLVGGTLGLIGGGGSALAVPLLVYGIGLETREAIATALLVVALAALAGATRHWVAGTLQLRIAVTFGIVGIFGSAAGAQFARLLAPPVQMTLFAVMMILAVGCMLKRPGHGKADESRLEGKQVSFTFRVVLAALAAGTLTGVSGLGGGFVVVPTLVFIVGLPIHKAIGTSLLVIVFNASGGVVSYASYVSLDMPTLIPFAGAAVLASVAGAFLSRYVRDTHLRSAFAIGLMLLGIFTIAKESLVIWSS